MTLSEEIRSKLLDKGASVVGFADLGELPEEDRRGYRYGIVIAVALAPEVVMGIRNGPTIEYYHEYKEKNNLLNELGKTAEGILMDKGFDALAKTTDVVKEDETNWTTELPHKTVATRAGIGWIGKCALLVTKEFGSAIRITSVLTNAELDTGEAINNSRCGECTICKDACPGNAVSGELWEVNKYRDEFFNPFNCRKAAREKAARIGVQATLCGQCIYKCPWTQHYLKNSLHSVIGGLELLPQVKPLWEGLREHHGNKSKEFSENLRNRSFENRVADFGHKAADHTFRIELISVDKFNSPIAYCISSLGNDHVGEVESIYIEPDYRGLYIGDLLMRNALKWMDDNGAKSKKLSVVAGNDVLGFYEKYGFKVRSMILQQVE